KGRLRARASRCTSTRSTRRLRAEVRAASNVAVHISPRVGRAIPRLLWGLLPLATIDVVLFVIPMVFMALFSVRFSEELLGLVGRWTVAHYVKVFTRSVERRVVQGGS